MSEYARPGYDRWDAPEFQEARRLREMQSTYLGNQQLADRTAQMYTSWPQMEPAVVYAMARSGLPVTAPIAAEVARTSQTVRAKRGFWDKGVGGFVKTGVGGVGNVIDFIDDPIVDTVKSTIRTGLTVAMAPFEEGAGLVRSVAGTIGGRLGGAVAGGLAGGGIGAVVGAPFAGIGALPGAVGGAVIGTVGGFLGGDEIESDDPGFRSQSTLGQAIGQKLKTGEVDLGSGFMPGGTARSEQERRATAAASIDGKGLTPGRLVAVGVFEPGSRPYDIVSGLIDATAALKLDPTVLAGKKAPLVGSQVRAARRTILPEKADDFITSLPGQELMQGLADEPNAFRVWQMSKGQLPMDTATRISNAQTAQEVASVIRPELGYTATTVFKPQVSRLGEVRLLSDMPQGLLQWDRPKEFIEKLDNFMKLAKVLPEDRAYHLDRMVRVLGSSDRGARLPAVREIQDMMADSIYTLAGGTTQKVLSKTVDVPGRLSRAEAGRLTRLVGKSHEDLRHYTAAEIATNTRVPGFVVNGKGQKIPAPSLVSELMEQPIPLPSVGDLRTIRQEINSIYGPLLNTPKIGAALHGTDTFGTWMMSRVWKPSVLARGALTVRVIGEEQVRMSAAGYDSFFSHPVSYISRLVADGKGRTGLVDDLVDSVDGTAAMAPIKATELSTFANDTGGRLLRTKHKLPIQRGEDGFRPAWLDHELGHLQADPVAQFFVKNGADATKDWLWDGSGRKYLQQFRSSQPGTMSNKFDVDTYVDGVLGKRIQEFTQDDELLLEYIGKGRRSRGSAQDMTPSEVKARKAALKRIQELDDAGFAPQAAVGDLMMQAQKGGSEVADEVTNWLFSHLLSRPTNYLNRSRVFQQNYWNKAEDMMTALTPTAQREAMVQARKAKLGKDQLGRLERRRGEGSGKLNLTQADVALKAQSLDAVQTLLYDLSKRGQWADATRLAFPFAEPWKEMLTTWGKLLKQDPVTVGRRAQTVIEGARGNGTFYIDEQTGQEMFAYPLTGALTKALVGVPVPMSGRVAGLNLFADSPVLPGFGPLVQIPAGALIPDKPQFDWLADTFNPYGDDDDGTLEKIGFPAAWMDKARKVFADPQSDRLFQNTVYDITRQLASEGRVDLSTEDGQIEATKLATGMARKLYVVRTLASFTAPSAPQMKFMSGIKDPEDSSRMMAQFELVEAFRGYQEENYDTAVERFLDDFGEEALLFMQPKTQGGAPAEEKTLEFARQNPHLTERYPDTWHFFSPRGGDFSYAAYTRQIESGQRKQLTERERQRMGNNRVAGMRYRKAQEMVGDRPNAPQRQWLDTVKEELLRKYPGFEPGAFTAGAVDRRIRELEDAVQDPKLGKTDVGYATSKYLEYRDQAITAAQALGLKDHTQSPRAKHLRRWLDNAALEITNKVPGFAEVYDTTFRREMTEDDPIAVDPVLPTGEEG